MAKLLQIAINEKGNIVSIFQVPPGRKCNCTCPECGEKLDAKNKDKTENTILGPKQKQAHFAHVSGKVCDHAAETALHKMAKEILYQHKTIRLPSLYHYFEKVSDETSVTFDKVELEQRLDNSGTVIIPDAILFKGNRRLLIEFYKTHIVDDNKKAKIKALGISALEVDLNFVEPIINGKLNYEGVKEFLENDARFREWLFNSEADRLYRKRSEEDTDKPKYSLDFLKKQDAAYEEEYDTPSPRVSPEDQARIRKSVNKWKDKAIAKGYELIKIYGYYDESVYCPKEKRNENKIDAYKCRSCEYFLNNYYPSSEEKYSLCGFKEKIKNSRPSIPDED